MSAHTLVILLGAAVPLPVAAITKKYAQPWVKATTNLVATALVASLAHLATADGHYDLAGFWAAYQAALAASVLSYLALWRHAVGKQIEDATADWGLGAIELRAVPADPVVVVDPQGAVVDPGASP